MIMCHLKSRNKTNKSKKKKYFVTLFGVPQTIVMFWMRMIKSDFAIVGLCLLLPDKLIQYM